MAKRMTSPVSVSSGATPVGKDHVNLGRLLSGQRGRADNEARRLREAMGSPTMWRRLEKLARARGLDLETGIADKFLDLAFGEGTLDKTRQDALTTLLNIRGHETKDYPHVAPATHKIEVDNKRVPDSVAGMPVAELQRIVMERAKGSLAAPAGSRAVELEVLDGDDGE